MHQQQQNVPDIVLSMSPDSPIGNIHFVSHRLNQTPYTCRERLCKCEFFCNCHGYFFVHSLLFHGTVLNNATCWSEYFIVFYYYSTAAHCHISFCVSVCASLMKLSSAIHSENSTASSSPSFYLFSICFFFALRKVCSSTLQGSSGVSSGRQTKRRQIKDRDKSSTNSMRTNKTQIVIYFRPILLVHNYEFIKWTVFWASFFMKTG